MKFQPPRRYQPRKQHEARSRARDPRQGEKQRRTKQTKPQHCQGKPNCDRKSYPRKGEDWKVVSENREHHLSVALHGVVEGLISFGGNPSRTFVKVSTKAPRILPSVQSPCRQLGLNVSSCGRRNGDIPLCLSIRYWPNPAVRSENLNLCAIHNGSQDISVQLTIAHIARSVMFPPVLSGNTVINSNPSRSIAETPSLTA